jgi:hypothetical protein
MIIMQVRNVHRRTLGSTDVLAALIDGLAGPDDRLWPGDLWPPMRLDRPLQVGARGGHGPIRYQVEEYEPGRYVRFRFERPRGFDGYHEFSRLGGPERPDELVHAIHARMHGLARVTWPLLYRPLHDALIEDALDRAQAACGHRGGRTGWSSYVKWIRRIVG